MARTIFSQKGYLMEHLLRIQVSVQILIPLICYSSEFILLIFYSCKHLQSARVCCDCCDCIVSQECDSVTSALFQRLRYGFMSSSLFLIVSYFSFRQSISQSFFYFNRLWSIYKLKPPSSFG